MPLTARQKRFVEVYDGNGARSARAAGYRGSDSALSTQAGRLLKNAEVARFIAARCAPGVATREQRQRFWTETMQDVAADLGHRLKASELLGKSEADFTDNVNHGVSRTLAEVLREATGQESKP